MRLSGLAWLSTPPAVLPLIFFAFAFSGACGGSAFTTIGSTADAGSDATSDGEIPSDGPNGAGDASTETGPVEGEGGDAPGGDGGPRVIYVEANGGSDTNTGLSPSAPKQTIGSSLIAAAKYGATEIHVCKGVYVESALSPTQDVALLGGYSCDSWRRLDRYGFPTFDTTNQTFLQNGNPAAQAATIVLASRITSATLVDGFTIQGATSTTGGVSAVLVEGTGAPVLSNNLILGGQGQGGTATWGSAGIDVEGKAAPSIVLDSISGGSGIGGTGSIGLVLNTTGAVTVTGDLIAGGHGTPAAPGGGGAVGVAVLSSLTNPITQCAISGTDAAAGLSYAASAAGVSIGGPGTAASAVIQGCAIQGGSGAAPGSSVGVLTLTTGDVLLSADRIYGGKRAAGSVAGTAVTAGVDVSGAGGFTILNSMVHAGTAAAGISAYGLNISQASKPPRITFDTIYTGGGPGTSIGINLGSSVSAATIEDDLLLGSGSGSFAFLAPSCSGSAQVGIVENVIFANTDLTRCSVAVTTVNVLRLLYGSNVIVNDGVLGGPAGCSDSGCLSYPACPGANCLPSIFSSWSNDDGVTSLFAAQDGPDGGVASTGWFLSSAPVPPCGLVRGGLPLNGVGVDANGVSRDPQVPTIGAQEYRAICTGPAAP